jgi:hypothetical protein
VPAVPPSYRQRLRLEGWWLVACGVAGSAALVATVEEARRWPLNTAAQVAAAGGIAVALGRRGTRRAMDDAVPKTEADDVGNGEPTPLWMHPLIVAGLALSFRGLRETGLPATDLAGWDASLRITAGAAVVGLVQGVGLERMVAKEESASGRTFYRYSGSRGPKTVLAAVPRAPRG